jgi:hypothetical protein
MTFCCQINFADSKDLTGDLPGDVLLVFADMNYEGSYPELMSFHWRNLAESDLVKPDDAPDTQEPLTPCYGSIYRTVDYDQPLLNQTAFHNSLARIEGMKIGGLPRWVDDVPEQIQGRFLCMIGSQDLVFYRQYPWLNVPESIETLEEMESYNFLNWGWSGNLYVFIDNQDTIHWKIQGY